MKKKKETAEKSHFGFSSGEKPYQKKAKEALPILVRQAKVEQPIYYSELAEEINMPNPRNLNYVLGAIGNELLILGKKWKITIPPIQCLVINKNTELPGEGINFFIKNKIDFKNASKKQKKAIVQGMLIDIFSFKKWEDVLKYFNLKKNNSITFLENIKIDKNFKFGSGGESQEHKDFKNYILNNPQILGLSKDLSGSIEYSLYSQDSIDVIFENNKEQIGVEVKSYISDETDIIRGMFQCIKYQSLLEAELKLENIRKNVRTILAINKKINNNLIQIKNILGVEVIDNIKFK